MSPGTNRKTCRWSCKKRRNGLFKSFEILSVPTGTMQRYVMITSRSPEKLVNVWRTTVLPNEHVNKFVRNCIAMDQRYYGLIRRDIWPFGLKHPFNQEKSAAGKKWLRSFFKKASSIVHEKTWRRLCSRGKRLFIRRRSKVFWRIWTGTKNNHQAYRIFIVDETEITTVQQRHSAQWSCQHEGARKKWRL